MSSLKYLFPLLLAGICCKARGQAVTNNLDKITARFNFFGITDIFDENISIGGEYRYNDHWSAGTDVAYIYNSIYLSQSKKIRGYIIRPFLRYYPDEKRNSFFEAQLHYKSVAYYLTDWIDKDVVNGVPGYQEYTSFHYNKKVYGINIIAGKKANLSRNKKLKLELYIGVGYRYKTQGSDIGSYLRQRGNNISIYNPEYSTLALPMGASLVYAIK